MENWTLILKQEFGKVCSENNRIRIYNFDYTRLKIQNHQFIIKISSLLVAQKLSKRKFSNNENSQKLKFPKTKNKNSQKQKVSKNANLIKILDFITVLVDFLFF